MTIKDIARLCGCGVATVSRVMNHHPDVSDEMRKRVMTVVEQYHFHPNNNARQLKQHAATDIAILVKGTHNMLFAEILEQVQNLLRENGRDTSVHYLDEEADEVSYAEQLCREKKPIGLLFLGGDLEHFKEKFQQIQVPAVLLTNTAEELGFENLSSLTTDDAAASDQAIEYLLRSGHKRIGILGGNWNTSQISSQRLLGCRRAFSRYAIPFDAVQQYEPCRYSMEDAYYAVGRLLDRVPDLTAIFAMSDVMAIGCIRGLVDRGKRVPEDISVIGYDGIPIAQYSVPRLTTIKQDGYRFAQGGVDILLRAIYYNKTKPVHDTVPFRFLEGESVAKLK